MRYRARTGFGRRMQEDRRFRIVMGAAFALAVNLVYGAGHAVFGVMNGSAWLVVMAAYYILLGVMRFGAVLTERRQSSEVFVMRFCGGMLMVLALVLAVVTALSVLQGRAAVHGLIPMLAIAAYTFWKMTMAIIHTVQAHRSGTPLTRTLRNITLASALMSLMTMQRSMLASFSREGAMETRLLNLLTGSAVCLLVFLMGLNMILEGKEAKEMAKSKLAQANQKIASTVVDGYKKIEDGVVGTYTKIEDRFVAQYLTREGETVEEAKARLKKQEKSDGK